MQKLLIALSIAFAAFGQVNPGLGNPVLDPIRTVYVADNFMCGLAAAGTTGCLGWHTPNVGFVSIATATAGQPGGIVLDTSGAINNFGAIVLQGGLTQDASETFWQRWNIVGISGTNPATNDNVRLGLFNSVSVLSPPTAGMYFEHCSSATIGCSGADTDWFCVANNGTSSTRTDTGVAFGTGTAAFLIRRIDSTHIGCKVASSIHGLPGATEVVVSGGEPTGGLVAGAVVTNTASESKQVTINWFDQAIANLNH